MEETVLSGVGKKLFGTSGIRGHTNRDITPELALGISSAYGRLLGPGKRVCVARDTRFGSHMLEMAVVAGFMSQGVDVLDCGCVPTPVLASYLFSGGGDGGFMVTGSHLPPDMVGLIPLMGDGAYMPDDVAVDVERMFFSGQHERERPSPPRSSYLYADDAVSLYKKKVLSLVDVEAIKNAGLRVAVDPANGTATGLLSSLLRDVGCEVVEINGEMSGESNRPPEPRDSTLSDLKRAVVENGCDFGAGLDVDGDRVVFVDEKGRGVSEDVAGIIFADRVFGSAASSGASGGERGVFVTPVNSSGIVEWFAGERGVELHYCRVGQPATVGAIKKYGAWFSYEESGKYYFARHVTWCDGMLATLKMAEILAREKKSLSEVVRRYPSFYQVKKTVPVDDEKKTVVMDGVRKRLDGAALVDVGGVKRPALVDVDGLKLVFADHSWLLIRASGTEPVIRVYSDSPSPDRSALLVEKGLEIVEDVLESL